MLVCVEVVGILVEILLTGNTGGTIQSLKEYSETRVALQNSVMALIFTRRLYMWEQRMDINKLQLLISPA